MRLYFSLIAFNYTQKFLIVQMKLVWTKLQEEGTKMKEKESFKAKASKRQQHAREKEESSQPSEKCRAT